MSRSLAFMVFPSPIDFLFFVRVRIMSFKLSQGSESVQSATEKNEKNMAADETP